MRRWLILGCVLLSGGCEAMQLRNRTVRQASTMADLQCQEVVDNLATFHSNPGSLPFFSLAPSGVTTIQQTATPSGNVNWDYAFIGTAGRFINHADKKSLSLMANQQNIETWNTVSTFYPETLQVMQSAYRKAVGCTTEDDEFYLQNFFYPSSTVTKTTITPKEQQGKKGTQTDVNVETITPTTHTISVTTTVTGDIKPDPPAPSTTVSGTTDPLARAVKDREYHAIHPGWYHTGCLKDVPLTARYIGRSGTTFVWVMPEDVENLSDFTMAILDIATSEPQLSQNKPTVKGYGESAPPGVQRGRLFFPPSWNQYIAPQP